MKRKAKRLLSLLLCALMLVSTLPGEAFAAELSYSSDTEWYVWNFADGSATNSSGSSTNNTLTLVKSADSSVTAVEDILVDGTLAAGKNTTMQLSNTVTLDASKNWAVELVAAGDGENAIRTFASTAVTLAGVYFYIDVTGDLSMVKKGSFTADDGTEVSSGYTYYKVSDADYNASVLAGEEFDITEFHSYQLRCTDGVFSYWLDGVKVGDLALSEQSSARGTGVPQYTSGTGTPFDFSSLKVAYVGCGSSSNASSQGLMATVKSLAYYSDCVYGAETVKSDCLKATADCDNGAEYYTSCVICGASSAGTEFEATFTVGSALGHDYQVTGQTDATCTDRGERVQTCSLCGDIVTEYSYALSGYTWDFAQGSVNSTNGENTLSFYSSSSGDTEIVLTDGTLVAGQTMMQMSQGVTLSMDEDWTAEIVAKGNGTNAIRTVFSTGTAFYSSSFIYINEAGDLSLGKRGAFTSDSGASISANYTYYKVSDADYYASTLASDDFDITQYHIYQLRCTDGVLSFWLDGEKVGDLALSEQTTARGTEPDPTTEYTSGTGTPFDFSSMTMNYVGNGTTKGAATYGLTATVKYLGIYPGHSKTEVAAVDATCTTDGNSAYYSCSNCEKFFGEDGTTEVEENSWVITAVGHDWDEGVITTEPTETAEGVMTYTCTVCGETYTEQIPAQSHEHALVRTDAAEATCTEAGNSEYYTCSGCGKFFSDEEGNIELEENSWVVGAKGHSMTKTDVVEATCVTDGNSAYYTCSVCGKFFSDEEGTTEVEENSWVIGAKGHSMTKTDAVDVTCTTDGAIEYYTCSDCGKFFSDEEGSVELPENGWIVAATGHTNTKVEATESTCTEDGNSEYYTCSGCGKFFSDEEGTTEVEENSWVLDALGHTWDEGVVTIEPTAKVDGEKVYTCTVCGGTKTENLGVTGEDYWYNWFFEDGTTDSADGLNSISLATTNHKGEEVTNNGTMSVADGVMSVESAAALELSRSVLLDSSRNWAFDITLKARTNADGEPIAPKTLLAENKLFANGTSIYLTADGNLLLAQKGAVEGTNTYWYFMVSDEDFAANMPADFDATEFHDYRLMCTDGVFSYWLDGEKIGDLALTCNAMDRTSTTAVKHEGQYLDYSTITGKYMGNGNTSNVKTFGFTGDVDAMSVYTNDGELAFCIGLDLAEAIDSVRVYPGDTIVLPTPEIGDYCAKFLGWSVNEDGTGSVYAPGEEYTVSAQGEITLYGVWTLSEDGAHSWDDGVVTLQPTCALEGVKTYTCTLCSASKTESVAVLEHTWDDGVVTTQPTCTEAGVKVLVCTECCLANPVEVPATGHSMTLTEAKDASCTEAGNSAYYTCANCSKYFSDENGETEVEENSWVVSATGHAWDDGVVTTAPTEETEGILTYTCATCGETYTEAIPELDHVHVIVKTEAKAATCTEAGNSTYYTCSGCGKYFSDENGETEVEENSWVISAAGHSMTKTVAVAATCTEAGNSAYYTCANCGKHYADAEGSSELAENDWVIAAKGHSMTKTDAVEPTCTEDGNSAYYTCTNCGKYFSDENGETEVEENSWVISAVGHSMAKTDAVEPTCTEDGNSAYYTCSGCGKYFSDENGETEVEENSWVITAVGHGWDEGVVTTAPTCTEEGVKTYTCANCGETYTEAVAAAGHSLTKSDAVEPTCTEEGNSAYWACADCGKYFSDENGATEIEENSWVIEAAGHSWDEGVVTTEPTATKTGQMTYTCTGCGGVKGEVIPATGTDTWFVWNFADGSATSSSGSVENTLTLVKSADSSVTSVEDLLTDGALAALSNTTMQMAQSITLDATKNWSVSVVAAGDGENAIRTFASTARTLAGVYFYIDSSGDLSMVKKGEFTADDGTAVSSGYTYYKVSDADYNASVLTSGEFDITEYHRYELRCVDGVIGFWLDDEKVGDLALSEQSSARNSGKPQYTSGTGTPFDFSTLTVTYVGCGSSSNASSQGLKATVKELKFYADGGELSLNVGLDALEAIEPIQIYPGDTVTLTKPAVGDLCAKFLGWAENEDGTGTVYQAGEIYTVDGFVLDTLYGIWAVSGETHSWDDGSVITLPGCGVDGEKVYTCTGCGETYTEYISGTSHSMVKTEAMDVTCTENGSSEYYTCTNCGKYYSDAEGTVEIAEGEWIVEAAGHNWDEGVVTTNPSAVKEGTKTYTCSACGETRIETIPATGEGEWYVWTFEDGTTASTDGQNTINLVTTNHKGEEVTNNGTMSVADGVMSVESATSLELSQSVVMDSSLNWVFDITMKARTNANGEVIPPKTLLGEDKLFANGTSIYLTATGDIFLAQKGEVEGTTAYWYFMVSDEDFAGNMPADFDATEFHDYRLMCTGGVISYWLDGEKIGDLALTCSTMDRTSTDAVKYAGQYLDYSTITGKYMGNGNTGSVKTFGFTGDVEKMSIYSDGGELSLNVGLDIIEAIDPMQVYPGEVIVLPDLDAGEYCARFLGWAENEDGTGTVYQPGESYTVDGFILETLYGIWVNHGGTHSWDEGVVTTAPTCVSEGVKTFTCTGCGESYTEIIALTDHVLVEVEAAAATCTETGHIAHWSCSGCGTKFADAEGTTELAESEWLVEALGHTWDEGTVLVESTCAMMGEMTHTCTVCGVTENVTLPYAHNMTKTNAVEPTCTEAGSIEYYTCGTCGRFYSDKEGTVELAENGWVIEATGHSWDEGVVTTKPSATKKGQITYTCSGCGGVKGEVIPATGEGTWFTWNFTDGSAASSSGSADNALTLVKSADSTVTGVEDLLVDGTLAALSNTTMQMSQSITLESYRNWTVELIAAGDGENAIRSFASTAKALSGVYFYIDVTGDLSIVKKGEFTADDGTAVSAGYTYYKVSDADYNASALAGGEFDIAEFHSYQLRCTDGVFSYWLDGVKVGDLALSEQSSARGSGKPQYTSGTGTPFDFSSLKVAYVGCGSSSNASSQGLQATVKELNFYGDSGTLSLNVGLDELEAIEPQRIYPGDTIALTRPETGDLCATFQGWSENEDGTGTVYQPGDVIEVNGFMNVTLYGNWTASNEGHSWDEGVVTTAPTCGGLGVKVFSCSGCDATYTESIAPTGHINTKTEAVAPTCTEQGSIAYWTCAECGKYFSDELGANPLAENGWIVDATGHSWDEGIVTKVPTEEEEGERFFTCTVCGETKYESLPLYTEIVMAYDDRLAVTDLGQSGEPVITEQKVTSKKVGTDTPDDAVIVYVDGKLIAVGAGTAVVTWGSDDQSMAYHITVEPAAISLIMITGHSLGSGSQGDADQSIVCEDGQVYCTNERAYAFKLCTGSSSAGTVEGKDVTGMGLGYGSESRPTKIDALNASGAGVNGNDSAVAYRWTQLTGEKIWILNSAKGSTSLNTWQEGGYNYRHAVELFTTAEEILYNEVTAGHYTVSKLGILNHTTANGDQTWSEENYTAAFNSMWEGFQREMAVYDFDGDGVTDTVDCIGLLPIWNVCAMGKWDALYAEPLAFYNSSGVMYNGKLINYHMSLFEDEGVIIASAVGRNWTSDADVAAYFAEYPLEGLYGVLQDGTTHTSPTTMQNGVYGDGVHYGQLGYNVQGIEAAESMYEYWYGVNDVTSVTLLQANGVDEVPKSIEIPVGGTYVVAPMTEPSSGKLQFEVTGSAISYNNCIITGNSQGTAVLTIKDQDGNALKTVNVTVREATAEDYEDIVWYSWDFAEGSATNTSGITTDNTLTLVKSADSAVTSVEDILVDGTLAANNNTTMQLSESITLDASKNWAVELVAKGDGENAIRSFLSTSVALSGTYFFIEASGDLCIVKKGSFTADDGTAVSSGYTYYKVSDDDYYASALADEDFDITEYHSYQLSCSNGVFSFWLDGEKVGDLAMSEQTTARGDSAKEYTSGSGTPFDFSTLTMNYVGCGSSSNASSQGLRATVKELNIFADSTTLSLDVGLDAVADIDLVQVFPGSSVVLPEPDTGLYCIKFIGWSENQDGSGTMYQAGDRYDVTDFTPQVLYAVWNTSEIGEGTHEYASGICVNCGAADPEYDLWYTWTFEDGTAVSADGVNEISLITTNYKGETVTNNGTMSVADGVMSVSSAATMELSQSVLLLNKKDWAYEITMKAKTDNYGNVIAPKTLLSDEKLFSEGTSIYLTSEGNLTLAQKGKVNGTNTYWYLMVSEADFTANMPSGFDATEYHTYRLMCTDGVFSFWLDGEKIGDLSVTCNSTSYDAADLKYTGQYLDYSTITAKYMGNGNTGNVKAFGFTGEVEQVSIFTGGDRVVFVPQMDGVEEIPSVQVYPGDVIELPKPDTGDYCVKFLGWAKYASGSAELYAAGDEFVISGTDEITLYGRWESVAGDGTHTYGTGVVTESTCAAEGYTSYTCIVCGHEMKTDYVDKKAHTFDAEIAQEAYLCAESDYDNAATYYKSCSVCGISSQGFKGESTFSSGRPGDGYYSVVSKQDWDTAPGITESEIVLNNTNGNRRQVMHVMEVDLSDPYASILPSYMGMNPTLGNYQLGTMSEQAAWVEENMGLNVVGAMNTCLSWYSSAYYDDNPELKGEPLGILVIDGTVYSTNTSAATCLVVNFDEKDGEARPAGMPKVELRSTSEGITGWEEQVISCNFGFIVKEGKNVYSVNHENQSSKSVLGIKADGTIVIMQNDGEQAPYSNGMSVYEIGEAMIALGCVYAVRCDGGGTSTYLSQRPGEELQLNSIPSDGAERPTTSGILVISSAPATGEFMRATISADDTYYAPGCTVTFEAVGTDLVGTKTEIPEDVIWKIKESGMGTIEDGVFVSNGTEGTVTVQMVYNDKVVGEHCIEIVVPETFRFRQSVITVPFGKTVELSVVATINDGLNTVTLNPDDILISTTNDSLGEFNGLSFTAVAEENAPTDLTSTVTATLKSADLTATAQLNLGKASMVIDDFEDGISDWTMYRITSRESIDFEFLAVDEDSGYVYNGTGALGMVMHNETQMQEAGYYAQLALMHNEGVLLENATSVGAWIYVPDDFYNLWIRMSFYTQDENGDYTKRNIINAVEGGEVYTTLEESGWYYFSCDISEYESVYIKNAFIEVLSQHCSANALYQTTGSPHGMSAIYVDDVIVDYSAAADDREAPIFGTVSLVEGETETALKKREMITTTGNEVTVKASVAEDESKSNATGLDSSSAKAYVDGVQVDVEYNDGEFILREISLANGVHRVKFEICDYAGNRSVVIRVIEVIGSASASAIEVVPADDTLDRLYGGSVYWMDVNATMIETIQEISFDIDLNATNHWELDHMELADGFTATYTVDEKTNTASITITRTGTNTQTGAQTLASLPIRVIYYDTDITLEGYTAETFWLNYNFWPQDVAVDVDRGEITYIDGYSTYMLNTFSSAEYSVDTEMYTSAQHMDPVYRAERGTAHVHTPVLLDDQTASCTEDGYSGRTFCEVCNSVVDWGVTQDALGHDYVDVNGVLTCTNCGDRFNGELDGKTYIDGVIADGWIDDTYYYVDGEMITGQYYMDGKLYCFDDNGVYDPDYLYTGFYYTEDGKVMYFVANEYLTGYQMLIGEAYYFDANGYGYEGEYNMADETCLFEDGQFVSSSTADVLDAGKAGPTATYVLYADGTFKIDGVGETYSFPNHGNRPFVEYISQITRVEVGEYITRIGTYFLSYTNVSEVEFAEFGSLQQLGTAAFYGSSKLTEIELPDTVTYVSSMAFGDCAKLSKVVTTDALTSINKTAFTESPEVTLYVLDGSYALEYAIAQDIPYVIYDAVLNGIVDVDGVLYYYKDGAPYYAGLIRIYGDYYYVRSNGQLVVDRTYWTTKTNGLLPEATYQFDESGKIVDASVASGIIVDVDGTLYYYENGRLCYAGLIQIAGDYYYVRSNGQLVVGRDYWCTKTNGLKSEGSYTFDEDGKMVLSSYPDGIVNVDGVLYYYQGGAPNYAGLIQIDGSYYYVRSSGKLAVSCTYWITKTNGLMAEGSYNFGADGKMMLHGDGIVDVNGELYYYQGGVPCYAGLIEMDGSYYYVRSSGKLAVSCTYWVTKTNGLMAKGSYNFGADGKMEGVSSGEVPEVKNGIVNENGVLRYYKDGNLYYAGLILINGSYYYVRSSGELVVGSSYWVTKTNDMLPEGSYTFGADGRMITG